MSKPVYMLNVGQGGVDRLSLVQEIYGPTSQRSLLNAGLGVGASVVELACGTGTMTHWIASRVGPNGRVIGVDNSAAQVESARVHCEGSSNVEFRVADATATGLPLGSFDIVYFRLLLMHLPNPGALLAHARSLLRPGGTLVCEEAAVDSTFCDPPVRAQAELHELAGMLAAERGCDYNVARHLGSLVRAAGFEGLEMSAHVPIYVSGPCKRLETASFREALGHWKSASPEVLARGHAVCDALDTLASDEATVYGLSTMMQATARAPGGA